MGNIRFHPGWLIAYTAYCRNMAEEEMTFTRADWLAIRQALLMIVDILERAMDMQPRTAQLRKELKKLRGQPERSE